MEQRRRPGRHPVTADRQLKRLAWVKEDNKRLFECYIRSELGRRGYKTCGKLTNNELTEVTGYRLADQVGQIKGKKRSGWRLWEKGDKSKGK